MDITARKQAESDADRFFTFRSTCWPSSARRLFKRMNPAFEATLGFSDAELLPCRLSISCIPMIARDQGAKREARKRSQVMQFENRYRCRDGSYKWLRWMCAPFESVLLRAHDITGAKESAVALQRPTTARNTRNETEACRTWNRD
jgi:PAS domain S-box-containing protein